MRNLFLLSAVSAMLVVSCGKTEPTPSEDSGVSGQSANSAAAASNPNSAPPRTAASAVEEGKSMADGADCLSCHKADAKLIGPSYQDIAAKYTDADVDGLAQKIIDGGNGVWGDVPMPPHAGLTKENATKMVKYILSLKK